MTKQEQKQIERAYQTIKAGELYEPDCALVDAIGVVPDGGFCDAAEALQRDLFFKLQRGA